MKHLIISVMAVIAATASADAQSALDAMTLTKSDFRGTARFMSMGGAFTALGGDLSTLTQNPAGIAVYRRSEIGATLDIDIQSTKSTSLSNVVKNNQTKASCSNFGYVGVANLDGMMNTFQWGVSYGRAVSFDRLVGGYQMPTGSSLTNYIAAFTSGTNPSDLDFGDNYNPYANPDNDWLSVLGYTSYLINSQPNSLSQYMGLYQNGTVADAMIRVHEKGYVDEYSFNFGGNFNDVVFWGLGLGVKDLNYIRETEYSESLENAAVYSAERSGLVTGNAGYYLDNWKRVNGTGWDVKFGLIFKPIQELRIGVAVHSPTWYTFTQQGFGSVDYSYFDPAAPETEKNPLQGNEYTDTSEFNYKINSPWRISAGLAGVIGSKFIVSADYEYAAYPDMKIKRAGYDNYGFLTGYYDDKYLDEDIDKQTCGQSTIRLGAEFRATPKLSLRAGYNCTMSNVADAYRDGAKEMFTAGTDPSFSLDKTTQNISCGLGYNFGPVHVDAAYVHTMRQSTLMAYTNSPAAKAPAFDVKDSNNQIVMTVGFRF